MARIGIYGGTFNPPHNGHLHAAASARNALSLDRVIFIPANIPPHKTLPLGSATAEERFEMVLLATASYEWAEVSDIELRASGKNYTVQTLRKLKQQYPEDHLFLIIGTDMLLTLDQWYQPSELLRLASVAAVGRNYGDASEMHRAQIRLAEKFDADIHLVSCDPLPMSSTQIRDWSADEIRNHVPADVYTFISERKLYRKCEQNNNEF